MPRVHESAFRRTTLADLRRSIPVLTLIACEDPVFGFIAADGGAAIDASTPVPDADSLMLDAGSDVSSGATTITVLAGSDAGPAQRPLNRGFFSGDGSLGTRRLRRRRSWLRSRRDSGVSLGSGATYQFASGLGTPTRFEFIADDDFHHAYGTPVEVGAACPDPDAGTCFASYADLASSLQSYLSTVMNAVATNHFAFDYYDLYNEPDNGWTGLSLDQLFDLFSLAANARSGKGSRTRGSPRRVVSEAWQRRRDSNVSRLCGREFTSYRCTFLARVRSSRGRARSCRRRAGRHCALLRGPPRLRAVRNSHQ